MDLQRDAKLGNGEEEVSLSMRMGSMVAEASAPAGAGTVDGLAEEARPPMFATRRRALHNCAGKEEDEVRGRGKSDRFPPIYSGVKRRFGSDAPTIAASCAGNGCTMCPTSGCVSFDPITTITTRAVCEEAACVAEKYSST